MVPCVETVTVFVKVMTISDGPSFKAEFAWFTFLLFEVFLSWKTRNPTSKVLETRQSISVFQLPGSIFLCSLKRHQSYKIRK